MPLTTEIEPGLSADHVFGSAIGSWRCEFAWHGTGDFARVTPLSGDTTGTMRLSYDTDTFTHAVATRDDGRPASTPSCPTLLSVDLRLVLQSADGGFDERVMVVAITSDQADEIEARFDANGYDFTGAYEYRYTDAWAKTTTGMLILFFPWALAYGELIETSYADEARVGNLVEGTGTKAVTASWFCERAPADAPASEGSQAP